MRRLPRTALAFAISGAAMLALEAGARRRGTSARRAVRALLDLVRPPPVADDTVEAQVRRKLARTARDPSAITVSIEHGCVDLRGPVETRERARIVRAIAAVPGVDSVLDLMTEPPSTSSSPPAVAPALARAPASALAPALAPALARAPAPALARAPAPAPVSRWRPVARVVTAGAGLGIALAAIRSGGVFAVPAAALGLLFVTGAAARIGSRAPHSEPHTTF